MNIIIKFVTVSSKGARVEFHQDPMKYLIQKCHIDANKAKISHKCGRPKAIIEVKGNYTIM